MVIACKTTPPEWKWSGCGNFVSVSKDRPYFDGDGVIVDADQKPLEIYTQILQATTLQQQWVLDICSGTGRF